jgi:hypothetical protein
MTIDVQQGVKRRKKPSATSIVTFFGNAIIYKKTKLVQE